MPRAYQLVALVLTGLLPGTASAAGRERQLTLYRAVVKLETPTGGFGSGSIVGPDGLIVTNHHVVADENGNLHKEIRVLETESPDRNPKLICLAHPSGIISSAQEDLAVVRCDQDANKKPLLPGSLKLHTIPLGNSDNLSLGDSLRVLGYPDIGGKPIDHVSGTVSGFLAENKSDAGRSWIKTESPTSWGYSGGAAINEFGELVGIPTNINWISKNGYTANKNFLRPINRVKLLIEMMNARPFPSHAAGANSAAKLNPTVGTFVKGTLLSGANGAPVPGARVIFLQPGIKASEIQSSDLPAVTYTEAETADDGSYQTTYPLARNQTYEVLIKIGDYPLYRGWDSVGTSGEQEQVTRDLHLGGLSLSGIVLSSSTNGLPLPNTRVIFLQPGTKANALKGLVEIEKNLFSQATTDAQGRFRLDRPLQPGKDYEALVLRKNAGSDFWWTFELSPFPGQGRVDDYNLNLGDNVIVNGTLRSTPGGVPLVGAKLTVLQEGVKATDVTRANLATKRYTEGIASDNGVYQLELPLPRKKRFEYVVVYNDVVYNFSGADGKPDVIDTDVPSGVVSVSRRLNGVALLGTLRSMDGSPLEGAEFLVMPPGATKEGESNTAVASANAYARAVVDGKGKFQLNGLLKDGETYSFLIRLGKRTYHWKPIVAESPKGFVELPLRIPGFVTQGFVVGAAQATSLTGKTIFFLKDSVSIESISVYNLEEQAYTKAVIDDQNAYQTLVPLTPGAYKALLLYDGKLYPCNPEKFTVIDAQSDLTRYDCRIEQLVSRGSMPTSSAP